MKVLPIINSNYNKRISFNGKIIYNQGKKRISIPTDNISMRDCGNSHTEIYSPYIHVVLPVSLGRVYSAYHKAKVNNKEVLLNVENYKQKDTDPLEYLDEIYKWTYMLEE